MPLGLAEITRRIDARCFPFGVPENIRVDGLARLSDFVVAGNSHFATLVTGEPADLVEQLESSESRASVLQGAVFATGDGDDALLTALERHRITVLVSSRLHGEALHAQLTALLADEQAAADRLITAGMKLLTQVARRGGVSAVIAELVRQIDGWAVLLDLNGQLITSAGAGRLHIEDAAAFALGRPVRVRHRELQVHQVGSDRDLVGFLVVSSRSSTLSLSRDLAQQASALFDLLLRTHNPSLTSTLGREALLDTILAGGPAAEKLLRRWGVHEASLTGFVFAARTRTIDLERLVVRWLDELGAEHVFSGGSRITGFVRDELTAEFAMRVDAYRPIGAGGVHLGLGAPAPIAVLERSAIQARQALHTALESGQAVVRYSELPTVDLVFDALSPESTAELAAVLDPLRLPDGSHGALTETLRVFLSEHGAHRASARRLGIHRQTLVARIQRVEALTGLSMGRADDRTAAWLGLRASGL